MPSYHPPMAERRFDLKVVMTWDPDARIWWAESDDLPGLATEAPTIPELIQRVMEIAPELIEDNLLDGERDEDLLINLVPLYQQTVRAIAH